MLLIAGPDLAAAAGAAADDLADSVIEVIPVASAGQDPDPPLASRTVALLNRGTPSSLVSPDGTLHIALMRSCSAWPSGVWIDGEKQTVPDGSSFAWQHWSHTFEYALAAGPGDWRSAGLARAGQEFNHDLVSCETGLHDGPLPGSASLGSVSWPGMLTALKPRGNPLASGRPGTPDRAAGLTARLRDLGGRTATMARLQLRGGITAAHGTGLAEDVSGADAAQVEVAEGVARTILPPAGTVTLALTPASDLFAGEAGRGEAASPPSQPSAAGAGGSLPRGEMPGGSGGSPPRANTEPAQPVFTRYWLHGKGPAPAGGLPVAVHLSPGRVALPSGGAPPVPVRLTVAAGLDGASGAVELDVPGGLAAEPAGPLRYDLPPLGHAAWDLAVAGRPGAPPGHYFLAARIRDELGQACEDVTMVGVGGSPVPALGQPLEELLPALEADLAAITAELDVAVLTPALDLPPGGSGELAVRVASRAASPVRGEAQLISPFGSWHAVHPWTRGFAVSPGNEVTLRYHVRVPVTTRRGTQWWIMVKLMYFGRLRYSSTVPVVIRA